MAGRKLQEDVRTHSGSMVDSDVSDRGIEEWLETRRRRSDIVVECADGPCQGVFGDADSWEGSSVQDGGRGIVRWRIAHEERWY